MQAGTQSSMTPQRASRLDAIGFQWNIRGVKGEEPATGEVKVVGEVQKQASV